MADLAQLEAALVKADAAGNVDDARAFANEIRRLRGAEKTGGDELVLAKEPGTLDNFVGGVKSGLKGAAQGIGQAVGLVSREDVASQREQDREVLDTLPGKIGNFVGTAAAYAPAAFIPGVNTVAGGALVGAGIGALQPSTSDSETLSNIGLGGVGGGIGAKVSQFLAARAARRAARSAAIKPTLDAKNAALKEFQEQGYVIPPQDANAGIGSQILNAWGGDIKTRQAASFKNQAVSNNKAAAAIGLPENEIITPEALNEVRRQAGQAYEAVKGIGRIKTDSAFAQSLDDIGKQFHGAAKDFPELANDQVMKLVDSLKKPEFGADSAIDAIRVLRDRADTAFRGGDKGLGNANKKAADAIESMIGRHLENTGADKTLIDGFRNARQLIAKTYSVEKALNPSTGNVSAQKLARQVGKKKLTGDLADIAKFGQSYSKSAQEIQGVNPFSVIDGGVATAAMAAKKPGLAAFAFGRPIAREIVLSPAYQGAFVKGTAPSNSLTSIMRLGSKTSTPLSALSATRSREDE